uniref:Uncharacterized protein n=1 Tax=Rhodnius prolixus TaxID=13249 RepID=T1I8V7_RHOPR
MGVSGGEYQLVRDVYEVAEITVDDLALDMGLYTLVALTVLLSAIVASEYLQPNNVSEQKLIGEQSQSLDTANEGRKVKQKIKGKVMMYLLLGMKFLGIGIIMPTLIALALYASWKGITISLLAFLLASIVGIKNLVNGKANQDKGSTKHVIVAKLPSQSHHEHWWRKLDEDWSFGDQLDNHFEQLDEYKHMSPYKAYHS